MTTSTPVVIDGAHVVTVDAGGAEHAGGPRRARRRPDRGRRLGTGAEKYFGATRIDGGGCLVAPGLVNTHQHLHQWITRAYATDDTLFGWLRMLYPI